MIREGIVTRSVTPTDRFKAKAFTPEPGRIITVKHYTRKRLEQEHDAMRAEARETHQRLISASLKWKRRTKVRMFVLRLIIGMLLSEDQELRTVGRELALMTGSDRSRRFVETHGAENVKTAVTQLWEDAHRPNGQWAAGADRAESRTRARWN